MQEATHKVLAMASREGVGHIPNDGVAFTAMSAEERADLSLGEPWGRRLWIVLAAVLVVAGCLEAYGINTWPMADDEVPSLVEMGLLHVDAQAFSVPAGQIGKLPRRCRSGTSFNGSPSICCPGANSAIACPRSSAGFW